MLRRARYVIPARLFLFALLPFLFLLLHLARELLTLRLRRQRTLLTFLLLPLALLFLFCGKARTLLLIPPLLIC